MIKILGLGDMAAATLLLSIVYNVNIPREIIIGIAVYLFFKALIFLFDFGSLFDIAAGILLILSLSMGLPHVLLFFFAALLGFKGILSLFG